MAYSALKRVPAPRPGGARQPQHKAFVAPVGGWVSAANLAAAPKGTAQVCENFLPTTTGLKMRKGSQKHGTAHATDATESLMTYTGATRKLFAAASGGIFDLTAPADPDVAPAAAVTGQTSNYYSHVNFATAGGKFMMNANGTDQIQTYDGTAWAALVSGAGAGQLNGVSSATISQLNTYRNRIWLVAGGTLNAWYLPTDSIAGIVGQVSLAGVFQRGGALLLSATWSLDSGDGLDDKIVFVSTEGEVAVYQGDPADATGWGLVGLYNTAPPLGKNAFIKVGGDLLILTKIGLVPLTAIISKDPAALALAAVSRNIQPDWQAEVALRSSLPWEVVKWDSQNIAFINCPTPSGSDTPMITFAVNLESGAWAKITGWDSRCLALHDDWVYFGTSTGSVVQTEITGADQGELIYYLYIGQNEHLAGVGIYTSVQQARAIFRAQSVFNPQIDVTADYEINLEAYPAAASPDTGDVWDTALWDVAMWDSTSEYFTVRLGWVSIGKSGFAHAPVLQILSGSAAAPSAELIMFEVTHQPGGLVV